MATRQEMIERFAEVTVKKGINLQKGQVAILRSPVENAELVQKVAEQCWLAGAEDVVIVYSDDKCNRMRYQYGEEDVLTTIPQWQVDQQIDYPKGKACYVSIIGEDPDALKGLDMDKVGKAIKARKKAFKALNDMFDRNEPQWTVVAAPTKAWAKKVFPECSEQEAVDKLWNAIFATMRLDTENPAEAWQQHTDEIERNCKLLNESGIVTLEFKNSIGTDLTLELAEGNIWCGGSSKTVFDRVFEANMPTEEVFTMPHKFKVNGKVVSSMPLVYMGNTIDKFSFTFENGLVVDYTAEVGKDTLDQMMSIDDGCKRLGEVALVPFSSPIRQSGILFLNTLFDENAACHLALGSAYCDNMKDFLDLTKEEREARGYNESISHVDFMFGTEDLSVVGTTKDGRKMQVFTHGEWSL